MMDYPITKNYIPGNHNEVRPYTYGIVLHSTATPGATDEAEQKYFSTDRGASAHPFVDWDSITQLMGWGERAWHAGKNANNGYIGIELCEPLGHDPVKFIEVWNRGVWLFAWLFVNYLHVYTVTKDNLMSHAEVSAKWPADTDHQDPVSYFASYNTSVDAFRAAVQTKIKEMLTLDINQALDFLKGKGVVSTPDYWLTTCKTIKYLDKLLINIATQWQKEGK